MTTDRFNKVIERADRVMRQLDERDGAVRDAARRERQRVNSDFMNWRISIIACAIAFAPSVAIAKAVVVRSLGPSAKSYPPGKSLPDTAKILLQQGDSVTVVGGNSARTLRGPGTFPAAGGAQELAMAASRRGRFGAMYSLRHFAINRLLQH